MPAMLPVVFFNNSFGLFFQSIVRLKPYFTIKGKFAFYCNAELFLVLT